MDMSNAPGVGQELDGPIGPSPRDVILELSQLSFIDSSGIRELVAAAQAPKTRGGALFLSSPTPNVARVFEITNVGHVFVMTHSFQAALDQVLPNQNS
jgi:anti-sigma B factor antagonist